MEISLTRRTALAIKGAILEGRLVPGMALPGIRVLSETLNISRNTIVSAIEDLVDEGWLVTEPSRGTFVASVLPNDAKKEVQAHCFHGWRPGFDLPSALREMSSLHIGTMDLSEGMPDPRLAPMELFGRAYQRGVRLHGERLFQSAEPMGNETLRRAISEWAFIHYGKPVSPDCVLITSGTRMAVKLMAQTFLKPEDRILVDEPGEGGLWSAFQKEPSFDMQGLPMADQHLSLDVLESQMQSAGVRFMLLAPGRYSPLWPCKEAQAQSLLDVACRHRVGIIEDDGDSIFSYSKAPCPSLWSQDQKGQVILMGSFSKWLAPGFQLGFVLAPPALVGWLAKVRKGLGEHGDGALEWAMAELIRNDDLSRHLNRVKRIYKERRDFLSESLEQALGRHLEVLVPDRGLCLWVKLKDEAKLAPWLAAAKACGLRLGGPEGAFLNEKRPYVRIGFAQQNEKELLESVRRMTLAGKRVGLD